MYWRGFMHGGGVEEQLVWEMGLWAAEREYGDFINILRLRGRGIKEYALA